MSRTERARQIIEVAERIFGERGVANTTMENVAEAAGITKPVVYDHFGSKEGLLAAILDQARETMGNNILDAMAQVKDTASPKATFKAGLVAYFEFMDTSATGWSSLTLGGPEAAETARMLDQVREARADAVRLALEQFPIVAAIPHAALEGAMEGLTGACERVAIWRAKRDDVSVEDAADIVVALIWYGIRSLDTGSFPPGQAEAPAGS